MRKVFIDSHNLISPLGVSSAQNFDALLEARSGVQRFQRSDIDDEEAWVSLIPEDVMQKATAGIGNEHTRFGQLLVASIREAASHSKVDLKSERTLFVFSTTKGSITLLGEQEPDADQLNQLELFTAAQSATAFFGNPNRPAVVSNACISGVVALLYAKRLLEAEAYDNAVVCGADTISRFVYSGFKSFQALSKGRCHPFSEGRDGINLGEAAATMILTTNEAHAATSITLGGGSVSSDANHISGPSKTGDELSDAINNALKQSGLKPSDIGFVSAHGTATLFNDEMESKAFARSGLSGIETNSLKGNFGHTLGAAGIVESVISIMSLQRGIVLPTPGFTTPGVPQPVNVSTEPVKKEMKHCLKTASGFGGCNAAIVFSKES